MKPTTFTLAMIPVAAAALLLSSKPASAQVVLNLQAPAQFGTVGSTFQFFGTLTNYGPSDIYLTSPTHTELPAGVTFDDSPFLYGNAPSVLTSGGTAGASYTGELFDVTIAPGTTPGFYSGNIIFTGGADPIANQYDILNTNGFSVAAVPEASTTISFAFLLALGLGGLVFAARKKKAASAA